MGRIYLDYAASAPLRRSAKAALLEALEHFGNPSSMHQNGQAMRHVLDTARRQIGEALHVRAERVVFTSGGTEANNMALRGVAMKAPGKTILYSAIEHDCVRNTALALAEAGAVHAEEIPVDEGGVTDCAWLDARLARGDVALVSVMHANNETGVLQPVQEAARLARRHHALMHTDAVQTVGHIAVQPDQLDVDLLTCTAHKLGGPQGIGALVVRPEVAMAGLLTGGAQERNRRAGTENVAAAAAFAAALVDALQAMHTEHDVAQKMAHWLEHNLPHGCELVAPNSAKVAHVRQVLVQGRNNADTVMKLDFNGVAISQGSACGSGRTEPSHVLRAMGYRDDRAEQAVRLSWGWGSSLTDVQRAVGLLGEA